MLIEEDILQDILNNVKNDIANVLLTYFYQ